MMLPHEREMTERLAGKPFTLFGINSDQDRSVLKRVMRDEKITWPNIWGGPPGKNEIAKQWNVRGWPTIYVLDHEGIIRYRVRAGSDFEPMVQELLRKVPASQPAR